MPGCFRRMDKWGDLLRLCCQLLAVISIASSVVALIFLINFDHWVRVGATVIVVLVATTIIVTVLYFAFDKKQRPPMPTLTDIELQRISYDFTRFPPDSLRPLSSYSPITIPRVRLTTDPMAPPTMLAPHPPPPSYEQSAVLEETRIRSSSNAPPAYNEVVRSEWVATFSPPPFYQPQRLRPLELPFSPAIRRLPRVPQPSSSAHTDPPSSPPSDVSFSVEEEFDRGRVVRSARRPLGRESRRRSSTLAQVIIDCSKAEPSMFSISAGESVI